jgi:uncharacterized protein (DUF952 family)
MPAIYKILGRAEWQAARAVGRFTGSAVDVRDGYIHFSAADQLGETARKHFTGRDNLVVLEIPSEALGAALVWEPSRGGALFPHLYGALNVALVARVHDAPLGPDNVPELTFIG